MSIASVKRDLLESLKEDKEFREAFVLENVYTAVAFQLRALREQRELSQAALGRAVKPKMAQERISILEDPNSPTKPTLNTLLRIANACDVGLDVRFIPLSKLLDRAVNTDIDQLRVNRCEDDIQEVQKQIEYELDLEKAVQRELAVTKVASVGARNEIVIPPASELRNILFWQPPDQRLAGGLAAAAGR